MSSNDPGTTELGSIPASPATQSKDELSHLVDYCYGNKKLPRYGKQTMRTTTTGATTTTSAAYQHNNFSRNANTGYRPYNNNCNNSGGRHIMMKSLTAPALASIPTTYNIQAPSLNPSTGLNVNPNDDVASEDCGSYVLNQEGDDDNDDDAHHESNAIGQGNNNHYKAQQQYLVSRGNSLDSDLTEGRHCNLFREGQQRYLECPQTIASYQTRCAGSSSKQIRINAGNFAKMKGDEDMCGKTLRSTGNSVGIRGGEDHQIAVTRASLSPLTPQIGNCGGSTLIMDSHNVARSSLHHNFFNNDSFESHLTNDYNLTASSSTYLMESTDTMAPHGANKSYMVPLDIPTPPPQPHVPHNLAKQRQWQCENIGNHKSHFNQVIHHHQHQQQQQQQEQHQQQQQQQHQQQHQQQQQQHYRNNCLASVSTTTGPAAGTLVKDNAKHLANGLANHHHLHQQQQQQQQQHQLANGLNYKLHDQHHQHSHHQQPHLHSGLAGAGGGGGGGGVGIHHCGKMPSPLMGMSPLRMQHSSNSRQHWSLQHMADKGYVKSLVYSPEKLRRVRIILGVIGGILIVALLGVALYFIITGGSETISPDGPSRSNGIHLDDVLQGKLLYRPFNGSWSQGKNILYKEDNVIMEINVKTKQKTRLMVDEVQQYLLYEKSSDGTLLLLTKNFKKNFRHSYAAEYDIYNISSGQIQPLLMQNQVRPLLMVQWAPVGTALIINFERNLYYKPSAFAPEVAITDDTNPAILNGIPDWVYEEEVFASNNAVWFNADGSQLAFIQFDDSATHVINFPVYGEAGDLRFQYPYNRLVAYPKAGSTNPRVRLFTSDLARAAAGNTDHLTEIPRPSALNTESDYIITVVDWLNGTNVLSVWMNRIQNSAHMQIFNGVRRQEIYSLESKTGWVDFFSAPFKNRDGLRIALVLPQAQDESGDYRHLCLLSTTSKNNKPEALTKGKYVVTAILHWDTGSDVIFYTANTEENPEYLHVYAIRATTGQTAKCLTCKLQKSGDVEQNYYSADFNTANQVIITSMGPGIPMTSIYEWSYSGNQVSLTKLMDWETNESLRHKLKGVDMPKVEIKTISIASGFTAKVLLQLPPNMDRSGKTKYPMLVDVYGGPDSYSVVNKWILDWGTYLSSNQSVIYAKIDGRGSGLRGEKLLHSVYLKLGTVEIADQIQVAKQLQAENSFIDPDHTGIWGWSYGGYAAAMALANDDQGVFHCAASIAPVTDWAYYDSIYTERYMSLPALNEVGYANSRLSTKAQKLKGKKFLLVHGTLDDNVHYQQAMILAKNLERNDILFKQISYPDEDHALAGVRPHLYHSLDRFFGECFAQPRMVYRK